MRNVIFLKLLFCLILLTACGPSPEALATQSALEATTIAAQWTKTPTPTPTATATFTPTLTNTPTPSPIPEWTPDYKAFFTDTKEIKLGDILPDTNSGRSEQNLFDLTIITDESFLNVCSNKRVVKFNSQFRSQNSEDKGNAEQIIARVILRGLFANALRNNAELQKLFSSTDWETTFSQFVEKLSEGNEFTVKSNLIDDDIYKLQRTQLSLPQEVRIIYYSRGNWRITNVDKERNNGMNITSDGKIIAIYAGLSYPGFRMTGMGLSHSTVNAIFDSMLLPYNQAAIGIVANGQIYGDNSALICRN